MAFTDILQEAHCRVPLANVEPLPWPGEPEPTPEGAMCSCGHPHEKNDLGVGARFPTARVRLATFLSVSARALRSAFRHLPAGKPSREDRVQRHQILASPELTLGARCRATAEA